MGLFRPEQPAQAFGFVSLQQRNCQLRFFAVGRASHIEFVEEFAYLADQ